MNAENLGTNGSETVPERKLFPSKAGARMQLTTRDKTLVRLLCRHNLLSTKQIQSRVFDGLELTTVMRRLRKLQAGGFIIRMGMLPCRTWVWGNSQLSNELFTGFASSSRTNLHTLHHDTQLSEVRLLLEEITRVDDWLDIRHIARDAMPPPFSADYKSGTYNFAKGDATLVPDAMFIGWKRNKPFPCALELELSIKAPARYRRIFSSYSYRKTPEAVLYIVENDQIRHAVEANAQYDMRREHRTIYTVRRQDLFKSRDNAVLQRVRDGALVRLFDLFDCKARMGAQAGGSEAVHQVVQPVDKPVSTPPRRSAEDALEPLGFERLENVGSDVSTGSGKQDHAAKTGILAASAVSSAG